MAEFVDLLPLVRRSVDDIRGDLDEDANAGIAVDDDRRVDTVPNSIFYDLTQPGALEYARLWDFLGSEVIAGAMLPYAYGGYLDDWGDALGVDRKDEATAAGTVSFAGPDGTVIGAGVIVAVAVDDDSDPLAFQTIAAATVAAGVASAPIVALEAGTDHNVPAGAITVPQSPLPAGVTVTGNAAATASGADVETDEAYRERLLLQFRGAQGSGTVNDYERWCLAFPGVGYVTVQPIWNGPGTVRVVITDPDNNAAAGAVVTALQAYLDPVAAQGRGQAPIGHTVTVATVSTVATAVSANLVHRSGYSLDGANGTVATRAQITAAVSAYVDALKPGQDVVLNHVRAAFFDVAGVYDVESLQLNGSAANRVVAPLEVAALTLPLTLGVGSGTAE